MMRANLFALFLGVLLSLSTVGCDTGATLESADNDVTTDVIHDAKPDVVKDTPTDTKPDATKPDTTDTGAQPDTAADTTKSCKVQTDCDDKDPCTTDKCQWGSCYHAQYDCGEGKACYTSAEGNLACAYTCTTASDCKLTNECMSATCQNGACQFKLETDAACNDNDACTQNDSCNNGVCQGMAKECPNGCHNGACLAECQNDTDCNTDDPCRDDECVFGTCKTQLKSECCSEQTNTCTNDDNVCTQMICNDDNSCGFEADNNATCNVGGLPGKCEASYCWNNTPDGSCFDNDPCTDDATDNGACVHALVCADGNPCTTDLCVAQPNGQGSDHTCIFAPKPNCCLNNSDCNDANPCTIDSCNGTCQHENKCLAGEPQMFQCNSDADCIGSQFGDHCLVSSEPNKPELKLCQPCQMGGAQDSCPEGEYCFWGIGGNESQMYSVYWCEAVVCTSASECDDNDPCTTDSCGLTECYHNIKALCQNCTQDSDCLSKSWCDEKGGGVSIQYPVCEPNGTCQLDYWSSTFDVKAYGCEPPIACINNSECPADGECILGTCYYQNGTDYPECGNDTHCLGTGTCNNATGVCNEYACYAVELGNGTMNVKMCPLWLACVNNQCVEMTAVQCQTDNDCQAAGVGGYCAPDQVTGDNHCYPCLPNDATGTIDTGCGENVPYCAWEDSSSSYNCVECTTDSQCSFGTECVGGGCWPTDDVVCKVNCPSDQNWTTAVIWYGSNLQAEVECGQQVMFTTSFLCLWGTGHPTFKFNLTDGVWAWGGGTTTNLQCNYAVNITPDPTASGTPNQTMGDLGVAVATFPTMFCN